MAWQRAHRADVRCLPLADRHYSRQKIGSPQFVPPGRCLYLYAKSETGEAIWVTSWPFAQYVKHAWAGAWVCSMFRNEGAGVASDLIRAAITETLREWPEPPELGIVTFIDKKKVKPTRVRGVDTWGYTYLKAGFRHVGETKGGLMAFQMLPHEMPGVGVPPPPRLADLPLGTRLVAGLGHSTVVADMDFETYSEAGYVWMGERWGALPHASQGRKGIAVVGAARYAEHPSTDVLCLRYDLKDGRGQRQWLPGDPPPVDLFLYLRNGGLIEAWNVAFERLVWEHVCVKRYCWPPLPPAQLRCAMAKARAHALPGALANAGEVLGADVQKDKEGKRLIQLYCVPRNPTKTDARLRLPPDPKLYDYCGQDIAAEAEISSRVPDLEGDELQWWQTDQEINARGVAIDVAAVQACGEIVEQALARYNGEMHEITSGAVSAASEIQKLTAWLHVQGVHLDSLDEEHVQQALTWTLPPLCRRALEIRAAIGSAAVKKLYAMQNQVCADGRLRGLFTYHGARTGRTTGNGPQATNLPNSGPRVAQCFVCNHHFGRSKPSCPWCGAQEVMATEREWSAAAVEDALVVMSGRSLDLVEIYFDEALPAISGCLRGMFVAAEGHDLICSDYSAIEAVVLAELAGETWRQEVFRTHGKIYEMSAAMVTGVTLEEQLDYRKRTGSHHPVRKKGKVFELALGYGGWVGSLIAFGADEFMTEDEMAAGAGAWRQASPAVVEFWGGQTRRGAWTAELFGIEGAAISAVQQPGATFECRGIRFVVSQDVLYCRLLSGDLLTYHRPRLRPSERRSGELTLSYEGWNSNPKNGGMGWVRMDTYGPKVVENIVQKTARDLQRHGILAQEAAGYRTVLHVYDENISEVPEGWGSVEEFERLMSEMPPWAAGWPVRATGGWRGKRYRKD